jgi:phospholipid-binding lipoprotein MlaA
MNKTAVRAFFTLSLLAGSAFALGACSGDGMKGYASNTPPVGSEVGSQTIAETAPADSDVSTSQAKSTMQASLQAPVQAPNQIAPAAGDDEISDPLESSNRAVFKFNTAVDNAVIHPIAKGYRAIVPQPARTGVRNFLRNLKSPTTFANQLLQGDIGGAGDVLARTAINSTIGIAGLIDVAGKFGMPYEAEDFGQTMGVWGVGHGPYIVVPILGPSSLRDYAGYFVDSYADPLRWWAHNTDNEGWYYAKMGVDYLDLRESLVDVLEDLQKSSIDHYASVRSVYYQRRAAMLRDEGEAASPDFSEY